MKHVPRRGRSPEIGVKVRGVVTAELPVVAIADSNEAVAETALVLELEEELLEDELLEDELLLDEL
jgi:hypothetical protein